MKPLKLIAATLLLTAVTALAYQAATRPPQRPAARPAAPGAMAAMLPQGALLTIESPDFAALLRSWNRSPQQKAWLASDNYSVFSNSRLFSRLNDARTEFEGVARPNAKDDAPDLFGAGFLTQVAGRQSIFAWYDVGNLEFLYISRLPAAQAARISLLQSHPGFSQRQSGGHTFYIRKSAGTESTPRTVAFAQVPSASGETLLLLATREDLLAGALTLIATPGASVAAEPWYNDAQSSLPAESKPPALHMVLNLDRLVPLPSFHTYWVQQQHHPDEAIPRRRLRPLPRQAQTFREERSILLKTSAPEPGNPALTTLAASVPQDTGVFRTTATHDPALAITALEEKLLGRVSLEKLPDTTANDPSLTAQQAGSTDDLETRIDAPAPISQTFSNQALADACTIASLDAVLTWSTALPPAISLRPLGAHSLRRHPARRQPLEPPDPPIRSPAKPPRLPHHLHPGHRLPPGREQHLRPHRPQAALLRHPQQPRLLLRRSAHPRHPPRPARPHPAAEAATQNATQIAGFDHPSQRAPYARLTSLIDGNNQPKSPANGPADATSDTPAYFSGNLKSLSDSFATLTREHFLERPADTPAGPALRQTVTYQWQQ